MYSDPTLYFHGDSPITLGDFLESYLVPGGSRYVERQNFYRRAPGRRYAYSNIAVALAGYVAEAASGVDFGEHCKERILRPLRMRDSGFRLARHRHGRPRDAVLLRVRARSGSSRTSSTATRTTPMASSGRAPSTSRDGWAPHAGRIFQGDRVLERATVHEIKRDQIPESCPGTRA